VGCDRASAVLNQAAEGAEERSQHDFDEFERLVYVARSEALAVLVVLLGGEAGLQCGEMTDLEWTEIDFAKRQLTVARSEWKGHVTLLKADNTFCRAAEWAIRASAIRHPLQSALPSSSSSSASTDVPVQAQRPDLDTVRSTPTQLGIVSR